VQGWALTRDLTITVAAVLFSVWVTFAAGYSAVYQAMVVVLAGIILYAFVRAHREPVSAVPVPADPAAAVTRGDNPEEPS
jgi:APA family basic amino acid/polyamine antiporter